MIRWTGLVPWEFEFPFPGSLTSIWMTGARGLGGGRVDLGGGSASSLLLPSLELSDTKVYEP